MGVARQHRFNCGDGNEFIRELDIRELQKKCGTLLLYDPYQATIDWDAITPYLNIWGSNGIIADFGDLGKIFFTHIAVNQKLP